MLTALDEVLRPGGVRCVFQPVVDLQDRSVVAYEALLRGPAGTPLESPQALLDAARDDTDLATIDLLAHTCALLDVAQHPDGAGKALFLNVEPRGIDQDADPAVRRAWEHAREVALARGLHVVNELTERALLADPAAMLWACTRMRVLGARIALDDVGANPESLALLPVVRPDVVKLDMRLVREHGSAEVAQISNAVRAYAEETGAAVVAEGVETDADHEVALVLGATLGQGWLYGRPGPLPERLSPAPPFPEIARPRQRAGGTPFEVVSAVPGKEVRRATKAHLLPISRSLEVASRALAIPPVLLGCFQHERYFTPDTARRYGYLATRLPLVSALGAELSREPAAGVRGAELRSDDPLVGEWNVVVLGAHYAAALVAADRSSPDQAERDRTFDYVVTHDRELVVAAAATLAGRLERLETGYGHADSEPEAESRAS